jgi:hypothetical protein
MVVVAQSVRAPDCGSGGRRFEPGLPPKTPGLYPGFFYVMAKNYLQNFWLTSYACMLPNSMALFKSRHPLSLSPVFILTTPRLE